MNRQIQRGFTLIELMIVVAIIGILAAIAIPQYQNYTVRAHLAKVASYADPIKLGVAEYAQENGGLGNLAANAWTSIGMSGAPNYATGGEVSAATLTAATGAIVLTVANVGGGWNGTTVTFTPALNSSTMDWAVACSITTAADAAGNGPKVFGSSSTGC